MARTKTKELHNGMDLIDSRDVIARLQELENEQNALIEDASSTVESLSSDDLEAGQEALDDWNLDHEDELNALRALVNDAERCADWHYGATLIKDDYFVTYAQELAEDLGSISKDAPWPANHIDWDAAAEELQQDYMRVDFDGQDYWVRS